MNILVIAQDLRLSGTSEGVVSRSFICSLRESFPKSHIELFYFKNHSQDIQSGLLPINVYRERKIDSRIPFWIKFINRFYWRITAVSLNELHIEKLYGRELHAINSDNFDLVFLRSSGTSYELLLGALYSEKLLSKSIINFHDPFPVFWDSGSNSKLTNIELQRLKRMNEVVSKAGLCMTPAHLLSRNLQFLYGSKKLFYVIPHQFRLEAFPSPNRSLIRAKEKKVTISYQGAIQFNRNIDFLLDAFLKILEEKPKLANDLEFVLRTRGNHTARLKNKYFKHKNIVFLETLPFIESYYEQLEETDIIVILENNSIESDILPGKTPVILSMNKDIISLSPNNSELRNILNTQQIVTYNDPEEILLKLKKIIIANLNGEQGDKIKADYFSQDNFNFKIKRLTEIKKGNSS